MSMVKVEEIEELLQEIEMLRMQLNRLTLSKGILDSEVIQVSQKLDELLNRYDSYRRVPFFSWMSFVGVKKAEWRIT
ncbi:aspartyl-phosphate phosphatase Spo0E family protein [Ammoniphilus sp. CFH 90114]|uniref:aspartyl-phosphate phosphatase Spo0E family protein n=1 Tax=Ammoniphilus sp. CFH 90114 TaxID=2493665 RepID=UPI001F0CB729|nr:aspartyl-phosphate phosphatase Spo0E family protein [Ammoniphilus sp. CFH 90114]